MLVNERHPQLGGIDRTGDGLHAGHRRRSLCPGRGPPYPWAVPRSWVYSMVILVAALIASMVIATIKLV
jgi:hypothetical protein